MLPVALLGCSGRLIFRHTTHGRGIIRWLVLHESGGHCQVHSTETKERKDQPTAGGVYSFEIYGGTAGASGFPPFSNLGKGGQVLYIQYMR
jgi:hypothetical protein